jgi:hypothetical protein
VSYFRLLKNINIKLPTTWDPPEADYQVSYFRLFN